jgi:hypothetical protein
MFSTSRLKMLLATAMLCASAAWAQNQPPAQTLHIGDPAPAIKNVKWFKGTPVTQLQKGKVYVIEFWASW